MDTPELPDITLSPGDVVQNKYRIIEKLGEGGFGAVYKVEDMKTKEEYAMKVESKKEPDSMVKVEVIVMQMLGGRRMTRHACKFIDEGETPLFRYVIMQLLGRSLSDLRKACTNKRFTASTSIRLGIQSLEAIENLHRIGFLHRDIKPGNFAMGRKDAEKRIVFMLDYGLCRQYIARDGQMRPPRDTAGFRGTLRYASINTHLRKELGRHDDLWSLYYMLIEMRAGELPWQKLAEKDAVSKKKQETPTAELLRGINDPEFTKIHDYLAKLTYYEPPNYVWFNLQLRAIALRNRFNDDDPFDWEPGGESFEACSKSGPAPAKKTKKKTKKKGKQREKVQDEDKDGSGCIPEGKDKESKEEQKKDEE